MTYPNNPRDPNRDVLRKPEPGIASGTMMAIAAAIIVALGVVWYSMSDNRDTASTNVPPATTGQSTTAPTPAPIPERAPAPAPAPKAQ